MKSHGMKESRLNFEFQSALSSNWPFIISLDFATLKAVCFYGWFPLSSLQKQQRHPSRFSGSKQNAEISDFNSHENCESPLRPFIGWKHISDQSTCFTEPPSLKSRAQLNPECRSTSQFSMFPSVAHYFSPAHSGTICKTSDDQTLLQVYLIYHRRNLSGIKTAKRPRAKLKLR